MIDEEYNLSGGGSIPNRVRKDLHLYFDPKFLHICVFYSDEFSRQWVSVKVRSFRYSEGPPTIMQLELGNKVSHVSNGKPFGLVKPDFRIEELDEFLPIDTSELYWYIFGNKLYHIPGVTKASEIPKGLHNGSTYEIDPFTLNHFIHLERGERIDNDEG